MTSVPNSEIETLRANAQSAVRDLRTRKPKLDDDSIDLILRDARSHYAWTDRPVPRRLLETIYEITAAGPTSMNTCPARFVFVTSDEGKDRLAKSLKAQECRQDAAAPVTAIMAHDLEFWTHLPFLFPARRPPPDVRRQSRRISRRRRFATARCRAPIS